MPPVRRAKDSRFSVLAFGILLPTNLKKLAVILTWITTYGCKYHRFEADSLGYNLIIFTAYRAET